jgi:hypothetical protein
MTQDTYNKYCDFIKLYQKYQLDDITEQNKLNKYISRIERLLADEYRYGSSRLDLYFLEKYLNKCEQLVQSSGY